MRLTVSPANPPAQDFIARDFEAFFPCAGTLGCAVCLTPQLFLPVYLYANVGLLAATLPHVLSAPTNHLHPSPAKPISLPRLHPPLDFVLVSFIVAPIDLSPAERKKELIPFATAWMELESIMLSVFYYHCKMCLFLI